MTKRPDIIKFAAKNDLSLLNDFVNLPHITGTEACLDVEDPDLFFSDFGLDIALAKDICAECPMLQSCRNYAMKHENHGVWGGLSADERFKLRGKKEAFDTNDMDRLVEEKNFILYRSSDVVASTYGVDVRTVVRWRNTIRDAQKAS